MSQLIIDGKQEEFQSNKLTCIEELVTHLRVQYNQGNQVISSIQINGEELTEEKELELAKKSISEVKNIEIQTLTKPEMSLLMLESVHSLLVEMLELIDRIYVQENKVVVYQSFTKLIDGLQAFTETIQTVKIACKVVQQNEINLMEADLLSVMKDLLHFCSLDQIDFLKSVLKNDLPVCIQEWQNIGIPKLKSIIQAKI